MMSTSPLLPGAAFDVYVKPFVPDFLHAINREKPLHTYPLDQRSFIIDYEEYIRSFSGRDFIPRAKSPETMASLPSNSRSDLELTNYHQHFTFWLTVERAARQVAQEQYDLYQVPIVFKQTATTTDITLSASFLVPGLGEESPHILVGDVVHLRPLALDRNGSALTQYQGYQHGAFVNTRLHTPGWNGELYHAEVVAVKKSLEMIEVNMTFSHELYAAVQADVTATIYNVHFPPRHIEDLSFETAIRATVQALRPVSPNYGPMLSKRDGNLFHAKTENWLEHMLFPVPGFGNQQTKLNSIHFSFVPVDKQLNHEQLRAVDSVTAQNYGTVPFLIHGPPGTGKTKTLVEIALQLLAKGAAKHILICAPSDPAADTLTDRLKSSLHPSEMLRLNSPSRTFAEVPSRLLPYCYIKGTRFDLPPFTSMMKYHIVVTTCKDSDILLKANLSNQALIDFEIAIVTTLRGERPTAPSLHWQALLIDEAAQATEPEVLIPLTMVAPASDTNPLIFVMAGDQQQLGPRTASRDPRIRRSLFERLLARPLYANHPLARHRLQSGVMAAQSLTRGMLPIIRPPFANLIRNYRSHPAILAVPNALFYYDTLIPLASDTKSLLHWEGWKGPWPVLFVHHNGQDEIETDGGGWYNLTEIDEVCRYAMSLLQSNLVCQEDICIMSPFSAQVRRLRQRFRVMGLHDVNIGPTEAFQGLESKAVILCTTRSRTRFLDQDQARDFGIIHEYKRFNVAITRAKHGLIVIGNHKVLSVDPCWRAFFDFCLRNNLFQGDIAQSLLDAAGAAPLTTLERILKQSEAQPAANVLAFAGELDDPMWIQGGFEALAIDDNGSNGLADSGDEETEGETYDEEGGEEDSGTATQDEGHGNDVVIIGYPSDGMAKMSQ